MVVRLKIVCQYMVAIKEIRSDSMGFSNMGDFVKYLEGRGELKRIAPAQLKNPLP